MKLLSYDETICNLGDVLQTIALEAFLQLNYSKYNINIDGYCPRSKLDPSTCDMIINGWNRHHRLGEFIPRNALYIGLHSDQQMMRYINEDCLVGCRDIFTLNELNKLSWKRRGILTYCSTITFPFYDGERIGKTELYHTNHHKPHHNLSFQEQITEALKLLETIQKSKIVYTDRLHVCLVAIAVGTDVVLTPRQFQPERYSIFDTVPMFAGFNKIITRESGVKEYMEKYFIDGFDKILDEYRLKNKM